MDLDTLRRSVAGAVIPRADARHAAAREALLWNARQPPRRPLAIVRAASARDAQAVVRFARDRGLSVSARGGGHHWSGIALQEGIVLDLSALKHVEVDAGARLAEAGPGVAGRDLARALAAQGLAFPVGHCGTGLHAAPALRPPRAAAVPADRPPGRRGARRRVVGVAARPRAGEGPAPLDAGARLAPRPGGRGRRGAFVRIQAAVVRRARKRGLIGRAPVAAVDATGLETRHVSAHSGVRRAGGEGHRQRAWPKLTAVVDTHSHLILGAVPGVGPSQDSPDFAPAMRQAAGLVAIDTALGDAGYDAEHNHRLCREELGVRRTVIRLNRRNTGRRWPKTPYRRAMRKRFPRPLYNQRWHAESAFGQHKRRLGSALTARRADAQGRELVLRAVTHNLMLLAEAA